jgi:hypothetical protein
MKDSRSKLNLAKFLAKFEFLESIFIIVIYLTIGYYLNHNDICMINYKFPIIFVVLAVLILFYGIQIGILSIFIFAIVIYLNYKPFPIETFLAIFAISLTFVQFNYIWKKRIEEAELNAEYKDEKLSELSNAFYSLKISHDQLEKNYIIKPMSIRLILEQLIDELINFKSTGVVSVNEMLYFKLLEILKQSFHLKKGIVIFSKDIKQEVSLDNLIISSLGKNSYTKEDILNNYIVNQAMVKKMPVFLSNENTYETEFLAAIPTLYKDRVINVLIIEDMPFTSFERENLTSISIILQYVSIEVLKYQFFGQENRCIDFIEDRDFKFELNRLLSIYDSFKKTSSLMVFILHSEIDAIKLYEFIEKSLRALDKVTFLKRNNMFYVIVLFPLNEKEVAVGFLNRLKSNLKNNNYYKEYMIFDLSRLDLFYEYITQENAIKRIRRNKETNNNNKGFKFLSFLFNRPKKEEELKDDKTNKKGIKKSITNVDKVDSKFRRKKKNLNENKTEIKNKNMNFFDVLLNKFKKEVKEDKPKEKINKNVKSNDIFDDEFEVIILESNNKYNFMKKIKEIIDKFKKVKK